jgi:ribosomal subunit interface protein
MFYNKGWRRRIFAAMQIKVTGKNLDIGEALRTHVDERLQQFRQKYFEGTVHAHVTVEKQRSSFQTDCSLHLATGLVLQSHGTAANAFPSFDAAAQHLEKQLKRYKQRLKAITGTSRTRAPVEAASYVIQAVMRGETRDLNPWLSPIITSVPELSVGEL